DPRSCLWVNRVETVRGTWFCVYGCNWASGKLIRGTELKVMGSFTEGVVGAPEGPPERTLQRSTLAKHLRLLGSLDERDPMWSSPFELHCLIRV
ncbi:hypothetical protein PIB30_090080, partial [Stylosanthes scabra]|nr:hypothetical protein [Stylosanthes scabra]